MRQTREKWLILFRIGSVSAKRQQPGTREAMRITKTSLAIDVAVLLIILVLVEWLSTTVTPNVWL